MLLEVGIEKLAKGWCLAFCATALSQLAGQIQGEARDEAGVLRGDVLSGQLAINERLEFCVLLSCDKLGRVCHAATRGKSLQNIRYILMGTLCRKTSYLLT